MYKVAKIAMPLTLIGTGWLAGVGAMSASEQEMGPAKAVELLAKSEAIDAKCRYLSDTEHEELRDYMARAEVVAAGRIGAEKTSNALRAGSALGDGQACGDDSEITVRATMDAARRAISARNEPEVSEPAATPKRKVKKKQERETAKQKPPAKKGKASHYSKLAAAYYVERRCKHLSHAQAVDFWKRVVRMHNQVLTRQGPAILAAAKSRAVATARANGRCGQTTARFVRASYRRIKRR